ncbi:MAG TPA: DinB family protein [Planctomycetota bacterium]|jgi:uncharacterized damage-inducible protein DinB
MQELIETWQINNRINLYVLNAVAAEGWAAALGKGRSVGKQFAHIHNVRLMWLNAAAPELAKGVSKIDTEKEIERKEVEQALEKSGEAIEALLKKAGAPGGKIKGFKPHAAGFLGYIISHESHHRGQIALILKQAGCPLDKKTAFGNWEWGSR